MVAVFPLEFGAVFGEECGDPSDVLGAIAEAVVGAEAFLGDVDDLGGGEKGAQFLACEVNGVAVVGEEVAHHLGGAGDSGVLEEQRDDRDLEQVLRAALAHPAEQLQWFLHGGHAAALVDERGEVFIQAVAPPQAPAQLLAVFGPVGPLPSCKGGWMAEPVRAAVG